MALDDGVYSKRRMPETHCWRFFTEVLLGLRHLHRLRIVHCDIKPDNILIGRDGRLKIADLGIAHFADSPADFLQNGDLLYAPVEVVAQPRTFSGTAVDVFCLAFSTLELLTGTNLPSYEKRAEWWGRVSDKSC